MTIRVLMQLDMRLENRIWKRQHIRREDLDKLRRKLSVPQIESLFSHG
jgi:hypothetical protein